MSSDSIRRALVGEAWSVSEAIFDIDALLDDEGRPVSERRARAATRAHVEMDVVECDYDDHRRSHLINKSALNQVSRYYHPVMAQLAGFRQQSGIEGATWTNILAAVIDQLAQPAFSLLQQGNADGPVPAVAAVGHKLGAGFFGVLRQCNDARARGREVEVSVAGFTALMNEFNALIGASEACAGPLGMIRKATRTLFEGSGETPAALPESRLQIAHLLAVQTELGAFWRQYDRRHCHRLLLGRDRAALQPFNQHLQRRMAQAAEQLSDSDAINVAPANLPHDLPRTMRSALRIALQCKAGDKALQQDLDRIRSLLADGRAVIAYGGDSAAFAHQLACYLHTRRQFLLALEHLELPLRRALGLSPDAPCKPGEMIFPAPQALHWYECVVGCRVGDSGRLDGSTIGLRQQG